MERKNVANLRTRLRRYEKAGVDPIEAVAANLRATNKSDNKRLLALLLDNEAAYNAAVREVYRSPTSTRKRSARSRLSPRTRAHGVLKKAMRAFSRKSGTARKSTPGKQGSTTILSINVQPARPNAPRARRGSLLSVLPPPPNTNSTRFAGPVYVYNGTTNPPLTEKEFIELTAGLTEEH